MVAQIKLASVKSHRASTSLKGGLNLILLAHNYFLHIARLKFRYKPPMVFSHNRQQPKRGKNKYIEYNLDKEMSSKQ